MRLKFIFRFCHTFLVLELKKLPYKFIGCNSNFQCSKNVLKLVCNIDLAIGIFINRNNAYRRPLSLLRCVDNTIQKSCLWETFNLLVCADSTSNKKNPERFRFNKHIYMICYWPFVICPLPCRAYFLCYVC